MSDLGSDSGLRIVFEDDVSMWVVENRAGRVLYVAGSAEVGHMRAVAYVKRKDRQWRRLFGTRR